MKMLFLWGNWTTKNTIPVGKLDKIKMLFLWETGQDKNAISVGNWTT
jgi:hypothetical protein